MLALVLVFLTPGFLASGSVLRADQPNVILIVCDDLNDYVEGFDGHPQAATPNLARLAASGVSFAQAHCTIPICGPSRASFMTGLYPHTSGCFGFTRWDEYEVLNNSRTLMDYFRANGYRTMGTGKLMHHCVRSEWDEFGNRSDYGPFAETGGERCAHPDVPAPFREIGAVDGSFGPLTNIADRTFPDGKTYVWKTGNWAAMRTMRVVSGDDRDLTADEINARWAVERLQQLAGSGEEEPFFMGVGFIRPHTPLIVPQKYFERFPLSSVQLPEIKDGDVADTFASTVRGNPNALEQPGSARTNDMGSRLYENLVASYETRELALQSFIQAYLASVSSVDDLIGEILHVVDNTSLADNTVIIVTSDHGWGMGEKDYLYKNSLWQESTRVPLIIRAPGIGQRGTMVNHPVSLVDVYPTLAEICDLNGDTRKSDNGRSLDGHSLLPFLNDPDTTDWSGPESALTALYKWRMRYEPAAESYSLRARDWRYIRYENGKEELYHTAVDPHEWTNLAGDESYLPKLETFRSQLADRVPAPGAEIPAQPPFRPGGVNNSANRNSESGRNPNAAAWKDTYFRRHPEADANGDGVLTWREYREYRREFDPVPDRDN